MIFWIGVERADQRADGFLIAPEKNERVTSTVQPGPTARVARADAIRLGGRLEGLFRLAWSTAVVPKGVAMTSRSTRLAFGARPFQLWPPTDASGTRRRKIQTRYDNRQKRSYLLRC